MHKRNYTLISRIFASCGFVPRIFREINIFFSYSQKIKKKVFKTIINDKGEEVRIEVLVNKRKVTRNIIDEKTGRVIEVETEVTTDDSDEDVLNPDGTISKRPKRRMRRGKTGGPNQSKEGEGRRRRRRTKSVRGKKQRP